jgi:hypothetical protein
LFHVDSCGVERNVGVDGSLWDVSRSTSSGVKSRRVRIEGI